MRTFPNLTARSGKGLRPWAWRCFCALLLIALMLQVAGTSALAQATASSALAGTVKDIKEAVVSGATVTATNVATGLTRTTTTNEEGAYRLELLPAGIYTVKVTAPGFAEAVAERVELLVGKTSNLDVTLSPSARSETVTVTSEVPLLDQQKTDVSLNITPSDVQDLPSMAAISAIWLISLPEPSPSTPTIRPKGASPFSASTALPDATSTSR
ncbi:MAG: hypothetical protein C4334_13685 [Pyrinomonas sp.]|uniref:carboxypeptidase-like regulatory domain-containing protein n=1 Tax=Pyrinomonas sp. TaxID=2080306 RepID=UPI003323731C